MRGINQQIVIIFVCLPKPVLIITLYRICVFCDRTVAHTKFRPKETTTHQLQHQQKSFSTNCFDQNSGIHTQ